ncbi:hypothetical protein CLOBOL_01273 [Enterocloster bolteae ATCC BAA-613]|uniref:Uncharacterized protein n=1 Tax=Enterocloster bolteae (strain ATCC BAA-613 / DSM 15670 / CCUG 46953 / JCM 12243 / WAL 16351) TaxID=411902 RepID=A8RKC9_ENTBW|nr:hypothetical protein CLOBOL_01273 [Enterocloster bolteae ATCC BAA-613]
MHLRYTCDKTCDEFSGAFSYDPEMRRLANDRTRWTE